MNKSRINQSKSLIIEATAGSGKTTLMVKRLSELILDNQISPDQCLAITFTEKAAKEMKDRLIQRFISDQTVLFPVELVSKMTICTIHSLCQGILKKYSLHIDQSPNFQIIEGLEKMNRLDQILFDFYKSYRFDPPIWLSNCLAIWSQDQLNQLLIKAYHNRDKLNFWFDNDFFQIDLRKIEVLEDFNHKYINACNAFRQAALTFFEKIDKDKSVNDWLDYDDVLTKSYQLLANVDWLRSQYQDQFQYIFVDEFQDTSPIQWQIVRQLCSDSDPFDSGKLWLVGDRCQAIYGFRGADDALMQMVTETTHQNLTHRQNNNNYRSHPILVNFINQLFDRLFKDQNESFLPMIPHKEDTGSASIKCVISESSQNELDVILKYINQMQKSGKTLSDIAILVRKNMDIKTMKSFLDKNMVPCQVSKGAGLCELDVVQVIICFLIGLLNPNDLVAWLCIIQDILKDKDQLLLIQNNGEKSLQKFIKTDARVSSWKKKLESGNMLSQLIHLASNLPIQRSQNDQVAIQLFISKFESLWESVDGKKKPVLKWLHSCIKFPKVMSIETESDANAVQIMTLHAAKGLEFPTVIIPFLDAQFNVGASDPLIISAEFGLGLSIPKLSKENSIRKEIYEIEKKKSICEELRLFYVTLTRAKSHILLTGKKLNRKNNSRLSLCLPYMVDQNGESRFDFPGALTHSGASQMSSPAILTSSSNQPVVFRQHQPDHLTSLSMSNLLDSLECPKQMVLKKFRPLEFTESAAQKEGLLMHALLASALISKQKEATLFDPDWLQTLKRSDWYQRIISSGYLLIEEPFEYQYKTHIIRGRFDAVWFCDHSHTFQIFEFKRSIGKNITRYQHQVNFYAAVLAMSKPGYAFDPSGSAIINIQSAESIAVISQDLDIHKAINNIATSTFSTNPIACHQCPYNNVILHCHETALHLNNPM